MKLLSRRSLFIAALLIPASLRLAAQDVTLRRDGADLRIAASRLRFLTSDAVKRLHDGSSVIFVFEAGTTDTKDGTPPELRSTRFVVSYDLWEEKYAVTRTGADPRSISHLTLEGAERWCLDALSVPVPNVPADRTFYVRLQYRIENNPPDAANPEDSRFTLSALIDIFSQRSASQSSSGNRVVIGGPFRLADLGGTR